MSTIGTIEKINQVPVFPLYLVVIKVQKDFSQNKMHVWKTIKGPQGLKSLDINVMALDTTFDKTKSIYQIIEKKRQIK